MSNSVFNFSFLAVIVFKIIWGPKFTLGGPVPEDVRPIFASVTFFDSISSFAARGY